MTDQSQATRWNDARPFWCPEPSCEFCIRSMDGMCLGKLPEPEPYGGALNTHRMCLRGAAGGGGWLQTFKINGGDAFHLRRLLNYVFPRSKGSINVR